VGIVVAKAALHLAKSAKTRTSRVPVKSVGTSPTLVDVASDASLPKRKMLVRRLQRTTGFKSRNAGWQTSSIFIRKLSVIASRIRWTAHLASVLLR
jgi:hypothetical protein